MNHQNRKEKSRGRLPAIFSLLGGWYVTSTPTLTANWKADSTNDTWTVPIGGGGGRLVRFGKLPVDLKLQIFWNAEKPTGAADWSLQFMVKALFPK